MAEKSYLGDSSIMTAGTTKKKKGKKSLDFEDA